MPRQPINSERAPRAIGAYSQAIRVDQTVFLSGQIPLDPATMKLVDGGFEAQLEQVFENMKAVAQAAGGSLADIAKLTVYLTDLSNFPLVNSVMERNFAPPYPARAAIGVAALPLGSSVEIEGILVLKPEDYSY